MHLIIDIEATCCNDGSIPLAESETIEIAAVQIPSARMFSTFVRPVRHPVLTDFCRELTGTRQENVDDAPGFAEAFGWLLEFAGDFTTYWSWGTFDRDQFARDCGFHGVANPLVHRNLADVFKRRTGHRCGHRRAMKHFGIVPAGRQHSGVWDACNIALLAEAMSKQGWLE